jgi:hypothetical protein
LFSKIGCPRSESGLREAGWDVFGLGALTRAFFFFFFAAAGFAFCIAVGM